MTYPHNPKSKAFSLDEPFVDKQNHWRIGDAATDRVQNALGEDQLPDLVRKRTNGKRNTHDSNPDISAMPAGLRPAGQSGEDEGRTEVEDALGR
jgi:hypothetical protein